MRHVIVAVIASAALAAGAAPASAAVTLGGRTTDVPDSTDCTGYPAGCSVVQIQLDSLLRASVGAGVVTSWRAVGTGNGSAFVAEATPGQVTRLMTSLPGSLAGTTNPTRLPIVAGQFVGLLIADTGSLAFKDSPVTGAAALLNAPAPAIGTPLPSDPNDTVAGYVATVEPDADGDGFGDETQDQCPSKPSPTGAGCIPPAEKIPPAFASEPSVKTVTQGKTSRLVVNVSEASTVRAKIERATVGRKSGKTCKKKTRGNAKRKRCTRYVPSKTKVLTAPAGRSTLSLGKFKAASYRATLALTDKAGNKGKSFRVFFKVKPKPKKKR